jgi:hypothetical protein
MSEETVWKNVTIKMSHAEIEAITMPVSEAMNQSVLAGHSVDEVLFAVAILLGSVMKQRGVILNVDASLREVLPAIVYGYNLDVGPMEKVEVTSSEYLN